MIFMHTTGCWTEGLMQANLHQAASHAYSSHANFSGTYPLLLVGHGGLSRVLARLHEVSLQLRGALLRLPQRLPGRLRIPQLQHVHEASCSSLGQPVCHRGML